MNHEVCESIRPCHIFQHLHSIWIGQIVLRYDHRAEPTTMTDSNIILKTQHERWCFRTWTELRVSHQFSMNPMVHYKPLLIIVYGSTKDDWADEIVPPSYEENNHTKWSVWPRNTSEIGKALSKQCYAVFPRKWAYPEIKNFKWKFTIWRIRTV